jgi:hypothetical protein
MNWREAFDESRDMYFRCALLRAVLKMKVTVHEISDCIVRMELLPIGLQSQVAWDIVCKPITTIRQFNRVKDNAGMLAMVDNEVIYQAWLRNHAVQQTGQRVR